MNLKQIAQKIGGYLQSKTQDDEGWFRGGKFTPVQQVQSKIQQNIQTNPLDRMAFSAVKTVSQPIIKSLANIGALGATGLGQIQMVRNKPESAERLFDTALNARRFAGTEGSFDQGIKSGLNTLKSGALSALQTALTAKGLKYSNPTNLAVGGLIGGTANKLSGGDFATGFGQGVGNTPQIMGFVGASNPLLNKLIPKTAGNVGGRIAGAGLNVAQGIGMDIARGTPTTLGSVALDVATGLAGGKGQFETGGIKVKGMTDKVFTQDKNIVNEAKQILKFNTDTPDQLDKLRDTMKVLAKKYELTSQPNWNKFTLEKQYEILSNQMDEMAKNWANVSMGIKGKNQSQISPESKGIKTNIDTGKVVSPAQLPETKLQTELPKANKVLPQDIIPTKNSTPEEIAASIPKRLDNFIEKTLGYSTKQPEGGVREASGYTKALRGLQENISTKVETGMASENKLVRGAATTMQNFFRGLGMSPERQAASMSLRGEMGVANERAFDVMDTLYKSLGNNKTSLEKINAVLDPEISKTKVSFDQLSKTEKQVYGLIREGLDLVHDTSYANGHISPEVYAANKGKYTPRLYEVTELPAEVNKFVTQGKKIVNDLYKQRKDIDAWKQDNSLNDPVYALGKRLSQVETNSAIKKYTDFLASNPRFISDVERPGFTKLSDSPAYGNLSGKYVLNSAAEDLKGFFFANQGVQNLYDAFRSYDRLPIRQLQKKLLTVFNPTTNVGNIVSDQVFGWVTGVNPLTLNKNVIDLKTDPKQYKQISDYLMRQGIIGTDITRTDFVNKLGSIDDLASGIKPGKVKLISNKIQSFYGGTDDVYKAAAFKALLNKGFSVEEATRKVADGFQNYANVGKFYDFAAKTPIIGKPFIKFQGDLIRIIKNGAVNNPLGLISFLGILKGISYLSSKASGESDEDRQTRETRFAAPMIPGLNIPLTWQTPIGEINVARYISPFYANNETTNILSNMIPGIPNIDTKKDVASNVAMNVNDPLVSPLIQLAVNRDFRGKPISDPNENKYQPSNLTPGEKTGNQAKFLGRSYLPPPVNSAIDVNSAIQGKPNMYGTPQTVGQSVARLGGIKISQYGPEEVQKIRDKDAEYQQYKNESLDKQISSVLKQEVKGDITAEQSAKRIQNLEKQKKDVVIGKTKTMDEKKKDIAVDLGREKVRETGEITEVQGVVLYPDKQLDTETGEYKTVVKSIDLSKPITKPKLTGNKEVDKKMTSSYNSKITSRISDIVKLVELEKLDADTAEKMIAELKKTKISTGSKKAKKITFKTTSPKALPKITLKISSPTSRVKLKSAPKIKLSKTDNRKYTIKA